MLRLARKDFYSIEDEEKEDENDEGTLEVTYRVSTGHGDVLHSEAGEVRQVQEVAPRLGHPTIGVEVNISYSFLQTKPRT